MDPAEFERNVVADGYTLVRRSIKPNLAMDEHEHEWETKGLVVSGAFTIDCDGERRTYRAGEVFELGANILYTEFTGPDGVEAIVGRLLKD